MKQLKLFLGVVAVAFLQPVLAQTMPRHTLAAGSGNFESASLHVSWTIGQAEPVATVIQPTLIFCGGFQQYDAVPVAIREENAPGQLEVFPNPCIDYLVLKAELEGMTNISYRLLDVNARVLASHEMSSPPGIFKEKLDVSILPPGIYNLMVLLGDQLRTRVHSFKIIKQ